MKIGNVLLFLLFLTACGASTSLEDFRIVGEDYRDVEYYLVNADGKLAFIADRGSDKFLVMDGKEEPLPYPYHDELISIEDKLAYIAVDDDKKVAVFDGKKVDGGHKDVKDLTNVGGKLVFIARDEGPTFIVSDGKKLQTQYYSVSEPASVNNKLAFLADKAENDRLGNWRIVYDEQEHGAEYDVVDTPFDFGGKLAYYARKNGNYFVAIDSEERDWGRQPLRVGDKIAYPSREGDDFYIVFGDQKLGKKGYRIDKAVAVGDKLAYETRHLGDSSDVYIMFDETKIKEPYDSTIAPADINGKLAFVAYKDTGASVLLQK